MENNKEKENAQTEEKKTKKERKPVNIYKVLAAALAAVLVVVLALYGRSWWIQKKALEQYEELAEQVNRIESGANDNEIIVESSQAATETQATEDTGETEDTEEEDPAVAGIDIPEKNLDWESLQEVNADIYAWVYIPQTDIDYPVLQHSTDDSYYLNYNLDGSKGYPGCIYTEHANSKDFTDFETVLYGHNMKNDSMFAELHKYEEQEFLDSSPYIYIYTEDKTLVYQVYTAYTADDAHILNTNDFTTQSGRIAYLESIVEQMQSAPQTTGQVELSVDSHLLTLSTCVSKQSDRRFLVQAVLLNEDAL